MPTSSTGAAERRSAGNLCRRTAVGTEAVAAPSTAQLRAHLNRHGSFRESSRGVAWRLLLGLPGNLEAHSALQERGQHPAWKSLCVRFPVHGQARQRLLRALSQLAFWSPILADVQYLPALVMPLTEVFGADGVLTFEFVVAFFFCWGHDWFDSHPKPPLGMLGRVVRLLETADPELFKHISACERGAETAAATAPLTLALWTMISSLLSELLPRAQWLALWDVLVSRWREPLLFGACVVALLRNRRDSLLKLPGGQHNCLDAEFRKRRSVGSVKVVVREAEAILKAAPLASELQGKPDNAQVSSVMLPLPRGLSYPSLCPKLKVDHTANEYARIVEDNHCATIAVTLATRLSANKAALQDAERFFELRKKRISSVNEVHHEEQQNENNLQYLADLRHRPHDFPVDGILRNAQFEPLVHDADTTEFEQAFEERRRIRAAEIQQVLRTRDLLHQEHEAVEHSFLAAIDERLSSSMERSIDIEKAKHREGRLLRDMDYKESDVDVDDAYEQLRTRKVAIEEMHRQDSLARQERRHAAQLCLESLEQNLRRGRQEFRQMEDHVRSAVDVEGEMSEQFYKRCLVHAADLSDLKSRVAYS